MKTQQIQDLLKNSKELYQKRHLKKAANTALIALDFGMHEAVDVEVLIDANILLSRIYTTNGLYQGEPTFFPKALHYIQDASTRLNGNPNASIIRVNILLTEGKIHQSMQDLEKARVKFDRAFTLSKSKTYTAGIVLSLAGMSGLAIQQNSFVKAERYAKDALTFLENSSEAETPSLLAEVYDKLSQAYIRRQEYSQSLQYSQKLLELSRELEDVEKELTALNSIAVVCGVKSNYKIGMQYFLEALDKSEEIGYRDNTARILINIATIYAHLYNYDDAIERYVRVLDEFDDILTDNTRAAIYNNSGNIYYITDRHKEALKCFEKSLELAEACNYQSMIAHSMAQLSRAERRLKNFPKSWAYAQRAQLLIDELGDVNGKQINLLNLSALYLHKGQLKEALKLGKEGIEVAKKMKDDTSELRGYRTLANIHKELKDYEKSLDYQVKYSRLQEEFSKTQRSRQFLDLEIRHAIKEQQKEIEALTKENEYQSILLQQSDQIARQNQELLQANEELKQFAYVASHDLKEPLRMIGSYTQLIHRVFHKDVKPDQEIYFKFVTEGVERMNNLLDALLKYATIGKSGIDLDDVDMNDVMLVTLFNLKMRIQDSEGTVEVPELPVIRSNQSLLNQLFQNLIGNGLKFSKPNEKPIVKVHFEEQETEYLFSVSDNGIGIPEEHLERIFVIFQRLHGRSQYEGTGIGLSICQKIVQKLGGRIWVESVEGEGATFYFTLPK